MFFACLSHSQATAYLLQRMQGGLVANDVERGNTYYRTTPRGVEYLSALNMMCEVLQTETKAPET
jgi:predicted transcriptional regulator